MALSGGFTHLRVNFFQHPQEMTQWRLAASLLATMIFSIKGESMVEFIHDLFAKQERTITYRQGATAVAKVGFIFAQSELGNHSHTRRRRKLGTAPTPSMMLRLAAVIRAFR